MAADTVQVIIIRQDGTRAERTFPTNSVRPEDVADMVNTGQPVKIAHAARRKRKSAYSFPAKACDEKNLCHYPSEIPPAFRAVCGTWESWTGRVVVEKSLDSHPDWGFRPYGRKWVDVKALALHSAKDQGA